MKISRRALLAGSLVCWGLNRFSASTAEESASVALPIGAVRTAAEYDLAGTLLRLSEIGYTAIELDEAYGYSPAEIRQMLDKARLSCAGVYVTLGSLLGNRFDTVVSESQILGNQNLILRNSLSAPLACLGGNRFTSYFFSRLAQKAKSFGMRIGIRSEKSYFVEMEDGRTAWDHFFRESDPNLIAELDISDCISAGTDPCTVIQETANRLEIVRVRIPDTNPGTLNGENVDWHRIFDLCRTVGKTRFYVGQFDDNPETGPLQKAVSVFSNIKMLNEI